MLELTTYRFGELGDIFDGPHATPKRVDEGPYFLNIASLSAGRLDLDESDHVSSDEFAIWTRRVTPQADDLLFSYETRLGEAALMPAHVEACLGRRMALLRPRPDIVDPRFLVYFYLSPPFQQLIEQHTIHGATVNRIGLSTMGQWTVDLPDLAEQQAIAEVLGALDDKTADNSHMARLSRDLGKALFLREVADLDGDKIALDRLVTSGALELGDGYRTKRAEHGQPGLRILRVGDVGDGTIALKGTDFVSDDFERQIGARASQPGDIILTTKGTVGRVAVIPEALERVVYSPQLCYFRVSDDQVLDQDFLAAWFHSADLQDQATLRMYKSDMAPYINLQDIRSLEIPLIGLAEQRRIGRAQGALMAAAHGAYEENRRLAATRDTLLPLLMSGKVRVKDAERVVEAAT